MRQCTIQFANVEFFTDSSNTLAWIQRSSRSFKPFVSARVGISRIIRIPVNSGVGIVIDARNFASWQKLIRVTAWIRQLAEKIRLRKNATSRREGPLLPDELKKAEMSWIRNAQNDLKSRIKNGELRDFETLS